jgi:hypothetical protein
MLPDADMVRLQQLALVSPRSTVLEAWRQVENAALSAAERHHLALPYKTTISPVHVIRALERSKLIEREQSAVMEELRMLRNRAAHAPDFGLTSESAVEYARTAARLGRYLDSILATSARGGDRWANAS